MSKRWNALPFFWQVYWVTVALVFGIVVSVELVGETLMAPVFIYFFGAFTDEHETLLWFAAIFLFSPLGGLALSRFVDNKLKSLAESAGRLAGGDFTARAQVTGASTDAFGELRDGFNVMAQKLEDLFLMERRLLADVSHELRSPLTRMSMALALAEKNADPAGRRHLELMAKELEGMSELVTLLLQQGQRSLSSTEQGVVDVGHLLRMVAADASFEGGAAGKQVTCEVADGLMVRGSGIGLRTLFANVVGNALKYTPLGEAVEISAKVRDGQVLAQVRDYGLGVPDAALEDIFQAFFRVDDSRARDTGGVGLGLAIAKQTAYAHGGGIVARNAQPGLLVEITLPVWLETKGK